MVKFKTSLRSLLNKNWIVYYLVIITYFIGVYFKNHSPITQKLYTNGLYQFISYPLSKYAGFFPFSITDLFYLLLLAIIIFLIIKIIISKKQRFKALHILFKTLAFCYVLFYWLWGFNYYKNDIYKQNVLNRTEIDSLQFTQTLNLLISNTNSTHCNYKNFNLFKIEEEIEKAYELNAAYLKINFSSANRHPKYMMYNQFYSASSIFGYFGPFFNEIQINPKLLPVQLPFVIAHEKVHQFGITSEAEANFYAYYICNSINNNQFKYSANLFVLGYFLTQTKKSNQFNLYSELLSKDVQNDIVAIKNYWKNMRVKTIDNLNGWFYDNYLKANNIQDGVMNYNGVVQMTINYHN